MPQVDISLSPHEHLAREWRMFESVESGGGGRFAIWEACRPTVVLGRSNRLEEWVHVDACRQDGVDILRRSSGGGAVVLGPGCVNYAVVVPVVSHPALASVALSFRFVLQHVIDALERYRLQLAGQSDLVRGGRKVSGNAQRRGRQALLHHGTVLYDFDPQLAVRYLIEPRRQPSYRAGRSHGLFLGNLGASREWTLRQVQRACEGIVIPIESVARRC
jgi:lipoate-protein ligase A